jgi:hypothetical protein
MVVNGGKIQISDSDFQATKSELGSEWFGKCMIDVQDSVTQRKAGLHYNNPYSAPHQNATTATSPATIEQNKSIDN